MALREIKFTVGADGALSPANEQIGGAQGEHKATELVFKFSNEVYGQLQEHSENGTLVYRFDIVDGEGNEHHSDTALLCGQEVRLPLEYAITQHGGLINVVLIVSFMRESADEPETFVVKSEKAQIKLAFSPHVNEKQEYEDISILVQSVKEKAEEVTKVLSEIRNAKAAIEDLLGELDNPNEFVFQGGNASGAIDVDFIIDDEMSDVSCNAVQNKVAMRYVDQAVANATTGFPELHPVGSVFITNENLTPKQLGKRFGGTWEKQKVLKSVCGRVSMEVTQTKEAELSKPITVSEENILFDTHHVTVSCITRAPQYVSVAAGFINSEDREDGNKYLKDFLIVLHRTVTYPGIPVHWHITGESYTDNNGNYHWIRTD